MSYQKILAAIDFSESAPEVLARAREMSQHYQAELSLIHVVEYLPPMDFSGDPMSIPGTMIEEADLVASAEQSMARFLEQQGAQGLDAQITIGVAKHDICRIIEQQRVDLLVIGSHGRHGLARLLGSTVQGVLHHVGCDVLAVRLKD